jgi:hypothetical protein
MTRDNRIKLKRPVYLNEEDVPTAIRKTFDWESVFEDIPVGKARQIGEDEAHYTTVRQALDRFQKIGKFKNYYIKTRKEGNQRVSYVVNPQNT